MINNSPIINAWIRTIAEAKPITNAIKEAGALNHEVDSI
jgi:hypothetical protein